MRNKIVSFISFCLQNKTISFILFCLFVAGLYALQNNVVTPFVIKVASSDFFLKETDDEPRLNGVTNEKTDIALTHCHQYLIENFDVSELAQLSERDYKAWSLGGYLYIIQSYFDVPNSKEAPTRQKFTCKIQYMEGGELEYANWNVSGFYYNE